MGNSRQRPRATGAWLGLLRAIEAAGGEIVRYTSKQHMIVRGPDGRTMTVGRPHAGCNDGRSLRNNVSQLRRIGLDIKIP